MAGVALEPVTLGWSAPGFGVLLAAEFAEAWSARAGAEPARFPPAILSAIERAGTIPAARRDQVLGAVAVNAEVLADHDGSLCE